MKHKKIMPRSLQSPQAARFLAGTVTARLTSFAGTIANTGDTCLILTFDTEGFAVGNKPRSLATVTITEVLPAALDTDLLIVGQARISPDSPEAGTFAADCGFSSFAAIVESFTGRLPFVGHVIRWSPYGQTPPQAPSPLS